MNEGHSFSIPIKLCLLNTPNCNLPQKFVSKYISVRYFQLTWPNQINPVYISWTGGISSSNCLELPHNFQFQEISDNTIVEISQVSEVYDASDIDLKPCTPFDWEIVATHAGFIENNLLRNKSMVFTGEILRITISSSLIASLMVKRIQCRLNSSDVSLGKLTNNTSLVIEPFISNSSEHGQNASSIQALSLCSTFKTYSLRVLPTTLSAIDTSYFGKSFHNVKSAAHFINSSANNLDAMLDALIAVDGLRGERGSKVGGCSSVSVHPLYFQFLFEQSTRTHLVGDMWDAKQENNEMNSAEGSLYRTVVSSLNTSCGHRSFFALATNVTHLKNVGTPPENSEYPSPVLVRVVMNERVRPFHIELSTATRLALQCNSDHDKVQLKLIKDADLKPQLPGTISLSPVRWSCPGAVQDNAAASQPEKEFTADITTQDLQSAFVRWVDTQHRCEETVLLCDGQYISLEFWRSVSASTTTGGHGSTYSKDFVVNFLGDSSSTTKPLTGNDDNQIAAHFILDLSDPNYEAVIRACLEALTLNEVLTDQIRMEVGVITTPLTCPALLRAFKPTVREVVGEIMTSVLPLAALDRLQRDVRPPVGMLLTGASANGKSTISQTVLHILQTSPRVLATTHILDCYDLLSMTVEAALLRLNEVFETAVACAPTAVCLDNLHIICPSVGESGAGSLRDERCSLLSLHLERLLQDNYQRHMRNHEECMLLAHRYEMPLSHGEEEWSGVTGEYFTRDRLAARLLSQAVFVLGTAPCAADVYPRLLNFDCLRKVVCLNTIASRDRLELLSSALMSMGVTLSPLVSADDVERVLEGFVLSDFHALASRMSAAVCNRVIARVKPQDNARFDSNDLRKLLVAFIDDISTAAASYVSSSTGKLSANSAPAFDVSWADIGGFKRVKRSILEVVRMPILYHKLYRLSPVKMPRAILLFGPPGCGKTYVAQAAGREFGVDFVSIRGPQLLDKYIGASEKAVRELFHRARETGRPTLLFFDEFEALAPKRGKDNTGITDRIVNQLLTFIDGVESSMGGGGGTDGEGFAQVFLIAATSRPDLIDGALLRPGRIEKHIYIGLPTVEDRASILNVCLSKLSVDDSVCESVQWIAQQDKAAAMTAADFKAVVSTAFLLAAHEIIDNNDSNQSSVVLNAAHLRQAFDQTRPSVSAQDMAFYASTYDKFKPSREDKGRAKDSEKKTGEVVSIEHQKMSFR